MALSANPISSANAAKLNEINPFKNTPSYSGTDSSLATGAGASLLGGGSGNNYVNNTPGAGQAQINAMGLSGVQSSLTGLGDKIKGDFSTPGAVPKISQGAFSLSTNPLAKLVSSTSTSISNSISANNIGNVLDKANLDSKISQLSGGIGSGLNGMTAGILSKLPSAGAENSLAGGASLLGSGSNQYGGTGSLDGVGAKLGSIGSTISSATGSLTGSLKSLAGTTSNISADISGAINKLTGGNLAGGIQSVLTGVSSAAGVVNNLLSLRRGINLPAGGELFAQTNQGLTVEANSAGDWRIRINTNWDIFGSGNLMVDKLKATGGVVWPYLPNITVSTKANYSQVDVVHSNFPHMAYKNSQVDEIQISGEFSCETSYDAEYWIAATTFFKTATKMFYGQGENAGNPPIICRLSGYGSNIFNNIPIIVKSFSVDLKDDVNYVRCDAYGNSTWVPVLSTITVSVMPIYNRANLRKFNINDYMAGKAVSVSQTGYI